MACSADAAEKKAVLEKLRGRPKIEGWWRFHAAQIPWITKSATMTEHWIQPIISIVFLAVWALAGEILIYGRKVAREDRRPRSY
jgi:hypothetical protein